MRIWDGRRRRFTRLTDPMFNSFSPAWDAEGEFLYILSDHYINPYLDRFESRFIVNNATRAVRVRAAGGRASCRSRRAATPTAEDEDEDEKDDDDGEDDDDKSAEKGGKKGKSGKGGRREGRAGADRLRGHRHARRRRSRSTPGNYAELRAVDGKLHWLVSENRGMMPPGER